MTTISNNMIDRTKINESVMKRDLMVRRLGKIGLYFNPVFSYFFLWAPILLLVIFSFNDSRSVATFRGFTTQWYENIFNSVGAGENFSTEQMINSLRNSLFVGAVSTIISTIVGTLVALAMARHEFPGKRFLNSVMLLPIVIPEITQAISLAIFFRLVFEWWGGLTGQVVYPGFHTIILGHVTFNLAYVAVVVRARLADMNPRLEEAAHDLGANDWITFWRITFPLILPGIIAGALLAFTLSLDDFVITFFTSGVGTTTLTVYVYGLLKLSVTPEINAISTLMLVFSTIMIGISLRLQGASATQ